MATQKDVQGLAGNSSGLNGAGFQLSAMPRIPDDVKARFPSMIQYEKDMLEYHKGLIFSVRTSLGTGIANS